MKRSTLVIAFLSLVAATSVVTAGNGSGPGADPFDSYPITGTVAGVNVSSGSGMPMITVQADDPDLGLVDVALGPIWFLQQAAFVVAEGDRVELLAYACDVCAAPFVAAWVENTTNATYVDLRDEDGRPLWTQRQYQRNGSARPGQGNGSGGQNGGGQGGGSGGGSGTGQPGGSGNGTGSGPANGSGLDMSQVETVTGEVLDFTGHAGAGQPVLTLDVAGDSLEITVSPYQPILAAGLVIEPGIVLTVTYAPTDCVENPHYVTISILDDATSILIQLRDPETGFPMAGGGSGHNRPNWP
jgi:hypothetical protein